MKLINVINAYIELQRSIGLRSETAKRTLRQFGRLMGDIQIDEVQAQQVLAFLQGSGPPRSLRGRSRAVIRLPVVNVVGR